MENLDCISSNKTVVVKTKFDTETELSYIYKMEKPEVDNTDPDNPVYAPISAESINKIKNFYDYIHRQIKNGCVVVNYKLLINDHLVDMQDMFTIWYDFNAIDFSSIAPHDPVMLADGDNMSLYVGLWPWEFVEDKPVFYYTLYVDAK